MRFVISFQFRHLTCYFHLKFSVSSLSLVLSLPPALPLLALSHSTHAKKPQAESQPGQQQLHREPPGQQQLHREPATESHQASSRESARPAAQSHQASSREPARPAEESHRASRREPPGQQQRATRPAAESHQASRREPPGQQQRARPATAPQRRLRRRIDMQKFRNNDFLT